MGIRSHGFATGAGFLLFPFLSPFSPIANLTGVQLSRFFEVKVGERGEEIRGTEWSGPYVFLIFFSFWLDPALPTPLSQTFSQPE